MAFMIGIDEDSAISDKAFKGYRGSRPSQVEASLDSSESTKSDFATSFTVSHFKTSLMEPRVVVDFTLADESPRLQLLNALMSVPIPINFEAAAITTVDIAQNVLSFDVQNFSSQVTGSNEAKDTFARGVFACGCPTCSRSSSGTTTTQANLSPVMASSPQAQIDALLSGTQWSGSDITYSFFTTGSTNYATTETGETGVASVSNIVKDAVRYVLEQLIEPLLNITFTEVTEAPGTYGKIRYQVANDPNYAYAYYPNEVSQVGGDVFFKNTDDINDGGNGFQSGIGSHGYMTIIHETLHALGLKHPGGYNGSGTGDGPFLPEDEDNTANTVMSYNFTSMGGTYVASAMLMAYDIAALQFLYGAKAFQSGNTTYSFSLISSYSNGIRSYGNPTKPSRLSIYDSGGIDKLDFSGLGFNASGYTFNLAPGGWLVATNSLSSYNHWVSGLSYSAPGFGTVIAKNTTIENILGSTSNDSIFGNSANNSLNGGIGADRLVGGLGNDHYVRDNVGDVISETSTITTEIDTVYSGVTYSLVANVENLILTGTTAINGSGNALNNTITGNSATNSLNGWAGADRLVGGLGNDHYVRDNVGDVISETSTITTEIDTVYSGVTYSLVANVENLILTGTTAINGSGNALNNTITGNTAANSLNGSAGIDVLTGGGGNDTLIGGTGNDRLTGGSGNDFFRFSSPNDRTDTISDFSKVSGNLDKIQVLASGFGGGLIAGTLASSRFILGTAATNTSQRFIYNQSTGALFFDGDGLGGTGQSQIATLSNKPGLVASDIVVI